ncbi:MAG TPA: host attachment protein [Xanthobacteraceae bacterium]|nr:host attachment protein [Xanthobacteraceae bacterium]
MFQEAGVVVRMTRLSIAHNAYVFVGDGRKALFLRNDGDRAFLNLKAEKIFVEENPPSRERGPDRPGREKMSADESIRSSMEPTDWHELAKHEFALRVAHALDRLVRERQVKDLIVIAPPRTLADLRRTLSDDIKSRIRAEIEKDLTKMPIWEIEEHLRAESD